MRSKACESASGVWLGGNLTGYEAQLGLHACNSEVSIDQERPASSPCPFSSSSSDSNSSGSTSDSGEEGLDTNSRKGGQGDEKREKKEGGEDGNNSDSGSTEERDPEQDDGRDEAKDKTHDGIGPTDDDESEESDESSDLENSYPRLPPAAVDKLITVRQQAAYKDLQLTEKLKQEVIADARQRHQERQQAHRSKKKKQTLNSKRRHFKSDVVSRKLTHLKRHHTIGSTDVTMALQEQEGDEWMVNCSCGLTAKNYDDGTSMIQCDSCLHWVHAKCADKKPDAVAQEKFLCFRCSWMFDCVCSVRRQPNHDDGQRMVECESCKTWQHTMCVHIPMTEEPADDYRCPRCVRKARRRKSASKGSRSRDRQRKRSHAETPRRHQKSTDATPVVAVKVRSSARSVDTLTAPIRSHRSRRSDPKKSSTVEKRALVATAPISPLVPAVSPPFTPPPPPSPPPPSVLPSRAHSRSTKHHRSRGHTKQRSEREQERSSRSNDLSHRKRGRSLGSCPSSTEKTLSEPSDMKYYAKPPTAVTPSPRGKGLMLRGYSPAGRTGASSSRSTDARPPLSLTPPSAGPSTGNSHNSHDSHGRKRNVSSARDRLAKKLKIRKSSLR